MKYAWRYLAVGVAVYLIVLIVNLPAVYASDFLQDALPELELLNPGGSVFSGQAANATYKGLNIGRVDWQFQPFALLLLRIEYRLVFSHPDNSGQLKIGLGTSGAVYGKALQMQLLPDRVINHFSPVEVRARGPLKLLFDQFEIREGVLSDVSGSITWQEAALESPFTMSLGEIEIALSPQEDALVAADVVRGGELGLSGEILLLPANRYSLDLVLRPGSGVSNETRQMLAATMQPHPSGGYVLKAAGNLP